MSPSPKDSSDLPNAILAALPRDVLQRVQPRKQQVAINEILLEPEEAPEWVFFPCESAVVSMVRTTDEGIQVEVGIVGYEGLVAVHSVLSPSTQPDEAVVQNGGALFRIRASRLRDEMTRNQQIRALILSYAASFYEQVSQNVVCNRLHTIEQRLSKWLLMVRDRTTSDDLHLTHDFLSHMLGIRRSGVTIAIGAFSLDGLIKSARNRITVRDREGLEARSCQCVAVMRRAMMRSPSS